MCSYRSADRCRRPIRLQHRDRRVLGKRPDHDRGGAGTPNSAGGSVGAQAYGIHPTITYTPLTGDKFVQGLITPIDPRRILLLIQAGYPADFILSLAVESLNGVRNRSTMGGAVRPADPEFERVVQLLREVQIAGGVVCALRKARKQDRLPCFSSVGTICRRALANRWPKSVVYSTFPRREIDSSWSIRPMRGEPDQLSVGSRSMLQILLAYASYTEVPEEHL